MSAPTSGAPPSDWLSSATSRWPPTYTAGSPPASNCRTTRTVSSGRSRRCSAWTSRGRSRTRWPRCRRCASALRSAGAPSGYSASASAGVWPTRRRWPQTPPQRFAITAPRSPSVSTRPTGSPVPCSSTSRAGRVHPPQGRRAGVRDGRAAPGLGMPHPARRRARLRQPRITDVLPARAGGPGLGDHRGVFGPELGTEAQASGSTFTISGRPSISRH